MIVIEALKRLIDEGYNLDDSIQAVAGVPMQLTDSPWAGLIWDVTNRRMIMSGDNRNLAARLLLFGLTGKTEIAGKTEKEMRDEWAGITGRTTRSVILPNWSRLRKA
jgi:hypothetical protein